MNKFNIRVTTYGLLFLSFILIGCTGHYQPDHSEINNAGKITLGVVEKSISKGMTSAGVIEVLGSPNMVTQDEDSNEVWVYDKVFSEVKSSNQNAGVWILIATGSQGSASTISSQKSLTIIIKFDSNSKVNKFSYRSTSF